MPQKAGQSAQHRHSFCFWRRVSVGPRRASHGVEAGSMRVATRSPSVGNDSEILSAAMLETRCGTPLRVSQAFAAHGDPKELFGVLANELHRAVQFDFIGVSFRDQDSDT